MQTQTAISPALVAKVKKLLNLSRDPNATENEIELAAAHAQRIMLEHNITIAQAEAADTSARSLVQRLKGEAKGKAMYEWQRSLMATVATTNFCMTFRKTAWSGNKTKQVGYEVIGREENVVAVTETFDYLTSTIERLAREFVGGDHLQLMSRKAMSFKEGAAARLQTRINRQHREAMAAQKAAAEEARASSSNALAVVMEDFAEAERCANEDFRRGLPAGTTARANYCANAQSKAWAAVYDAVMEAKITDKEIAEQIAKAAAEPILASFGLTDKEIESRLDGTVRSGVYSAMEELAPKKARKAGRARAYRYRSGRQDKPRDHGAYDAGGAAGDRVSLNKQVAENSASVRRIG